MINYAWIWVSYSSNCLLLKGLYWSDSSDETAKTKVNCQSMSTTMNIPYCKILQPFSDSEVFLKQKTNIKK